MKTKFITLIVALATFATVILAQQYERVVKIYKDGEILNSYLISEVDSIKFDKVALYQVGVTANNSEAGYVLINDNTTSDLFKEGESITLKAVANSGYQFVNWTLNGSVVSTNSTCSVVVNGAVTYVANFEENQLQYCIPEGTMLSSRQLNSFTLTDGTNSLSLSNIQTSTRDAVYKDKTEFYLHTQQGETLNFSEMDWTGAWMHAFVYIDYNRDGVFNTTSNPYGNNDGELVSYNFYSSDDSSVGTDSKGNVVSNSCGVYANNIPSWTLPENLESGEYRMRFKIDWESLDPCGSTDSKNSIQNNGGVVCDLTLRVGSTDLLYDVTFKSTPQLAGTASVVDENFDKATLLATANAGYVFECWKINGLQISTDNPYVATISANTEIEVCFRQAETVTVSATVAKGGSVEVSNPNPLEGTEVTLTATANAGFQFESWSLNGEVVSIENPYTITARGNAEYVATFTDMYSQLTTVPTIYINTENGVGVTSKEDYVNAYVTVRGAENEEDNITEVLTEIKGRGNSTWGMAKKPYRLKFDEKIKFLGNEAKEKNWVLLANYADKTLMRNALAFETARNMMNFGFTPSVTFVDVVLNGENLGSYMLTDQVEVKKKRVPVTEQETTTTMSDAEITGGYLIEVDGFADSEISWFQTSQGMKVTIKYPKDDEINSDQSAYIANYTQNMENAMFSTNFTDAELGWRKYIDEASMVDWYIACELFGNSDAWWS
ncbi:MAG: CotH kinase family protein, partial [Bacteroidaceae bacterium]|nr:CotH kinase family protein [Bacteroidaceae bacterium]